MYKITYQKRNGEVFDRIRATLPVNSIGDETSMGWTILNIQFGLGSKYYNLREYQIKNRKQIKKYRIYKTINRFLKRYSTTFALIILIPLYLFK